MLSLPVACLIIVSVFCTSFISGILGMAGGMILMGILVSVVSVQSAMILHAIAQLFANLSRTVFHWKKIHAGSIAYFVVGIAVIFAAFAAIKFVPSKMLVLLMMGIAPFMGYVMRNRISFHFTKPSHAFLCGMVITFFQLGAGTAGPWLDIFFQQLKISRHEIIATKSAAMSISHLSKFVYFGMVVTTLGAHGEEVQPWLWPVIVVVSFWGTHISRKVLDFMTDKQFYKATQATLLVIGTVYLYKALHLWIAG